MGPPARASMLFLCLLLCVRVLGQNTIGLPQIINYPKETYIAGTQNWDVRQDKSGIMYFANNEGLMSFDGSNWKINPLPNATIVRSLEIGPENRIYVGGQDEIGYFSPNSQGNLVFSSLKTLIAEPDRSFADVWDIVAFGKDLFFRSESRIFQLSAGRMSVYKNDHWRFLGRSNDRLVAESGNNKLLIFHNGIWEPFVKKSALPEDFLVTSLVPLGKDSTLIVKERNLKVE